MTLSVKNNKGFVLSTVPKSKKYDLSFSVWNRYNNMVVSWLVHSISLPIRHSIIWMDMASDMWNDLKMRYSKETSIEFSIYKWKCLLWVNVTFLLHNFLPN